MFFELQKQQKSWPNALQIPVEKAEQAALFHDIAKCMDKSELHQILEREKEDSTAFSIPS